MKTTDIGFEQFESDFYADLSTAFIKPEDLEKYTKIVNPSLEHRKKFLEWKRPYVIAAWERYVQQDNGANIEFKEVENMCVSSNKYVKKNYKIDFFKKFRICPNCEKHMSFYIDFDFGGTLGVFSCDCGYKDSSYNNYAYATNDEREEFEEATKDIMW